MTSTGNPDLYFQDDLEGDNIKRQFLNFLNEFTVQDENDPDRVVYHYKNEAENMKRNKRTTMYVNYEHLIDYSGTYDLAEIIQLEYYK